DRAWIGGIYRYADAAHAGNQLRKRSHQLSAKIGREVAAARGVAAGMCKTRRESRPDRVWDAQEGEWNCRSRASDSESGGCRPSNNDIDVAVQNLGDEAGFLCERDLRPAYVNGQVLSFGPAALLERFAKGAKHRRERRRRPDHGYAPNPTSLLRARRERPCCRTTKKRDELAALHAISQRPRIT